MTLAVAEKISFFELAKRVLEKVGTPMTAGEIWQYAEQTGIAALLQSTGKTPEASLGARLYTDVQKPTSAFVKLGSRPARLHEQRMDLCEGINAPFDQFLEIIRRIGIRKMHRRLHRGQDVPCSMLGLARESDDLRLVPFVLSNIPSDFRRADDFALGVFDR